VIPREGRKGPPYTYNALFAKPLVKCSDGRAVKALPYTSLGSPRNILLRAACEYYNAARRAWGVTNKEIENT